MSGFAALEDVDAAATAGETPADREPDGAATDDGDPWMRSRKGGFGADGGLPSLV